MLYKKRKPYQIDYTEEFGIKPDKVILRKVKPIIVMEKKDRINILSAVKKKEPLLIQCVDEHEILGYQIPENEIEERDSVLLTANLKEPLTTEYIDELVLEGEIKPENKIQLIDQMEILKELKPENEIEYLDEIKFIHLQKPQHQWITILSDIRNS